MHFGTVTVVVVAVVLVAVVVVVVMGSQLSHIALHRLFMLPKMHALKPKAGQSASSV